MSSASDDRRDARGSGRLTIPLRTELLVLALPAVLLALVASGPVQRQANASPRGHAGSKPQVLRVCADPNNLPFSNDKQEGFENRIATLIAADLGVPLRYTWWPERRGFVRNTLKARICDVVMEVPSEYELTERTAPYYRSTYVFVTRADRHLAIRSFDDPALRHLRIGIHMMGDDYANSPAAAALARRGLGGQVVPFMIYGDYSEPNPPARLIRAVEEDSIDVAVAWGPLAGYFAKHSPTHLRLTPVIPTAGVQFAAQVPRRARDEVFAYSMAMGVRHGDSTWRAILDAELTRRHDAIRKILEDYGVPLVASGAR